jgi:23S rRNA (cytosine1962-C5)-methyltransferase
VTDREPDEAVAAAVIAADTSTEYRLLDLGNGRQLARFGDLTVDRPFPAAFEPVRDPAAWLRADLRYERAGRTDGSWVSAGPLPESWIMRHEGLVFELRPTPSGQVGFFAEQIEPWRWLRLEMRRASRQLGRPPALLNLFAYTGGSTLAAAAEGAAITHVDSVRSAVAWGRRNAELSGLGAAPVRWIVDDAVAFAGRELRRGRRFDGIIVDPPSYGHGPGGERWVLAERLPDLLDTCLALTGGTPQLVLLTAHSEGLESGQLGVELSDAFWRAGLGRVAGSIEAQPLILRAGSGASAPAGVMARWQAQ